MSEQSELPDSILSNPSINLVLERPSVSDRDSLSCTLFEVRMWVRNFFVWLQFCVPKIVETIHRSKNDYRPFLHAHCPVSRESQRRRNPVEHQQEADVDNCLQRFPHLPFVFTLHVLVWLGVILVMNNLSIVFLSLRQRIGAIKFNEGDSHWARPDLIICVTKNWLEMWRKFDTKFYCPVDTTWITFIKFYRSNPLP